MQSKAKDRSTDLLLDRRDLMRVVSVGAIAVAAGVCALAEPRAAASIEGAGALVEAEIRAFKLYTGADNASHVLEGTIDQKSRTDVVAIHFKESPAYSSSEWHNDPEAHYVITLSGTLEFTVRDGETFVVRPGDVLLGENEVGAGHKWRLIDDQPWRRAYVVLKPGARDSFVAKARA
jgi:quercetin dioxygenase-like cupin family protein